MQQSTLDFDSFGRHCSAEAPAIQNPKKQGVQGRKGLMQRLNGQLTRRRVVYLDPGVDRWLLKYVAEHKRDCPHEKLDASTVVETALREFLGRHR